PEPGGAADRGRALGVPHLAELVPSGGRAPPEPVTCTPAPAPFRRIAGVPPKDRRDPGGRVGRRVPATPRAPAARRYGFGRGSTARRRSISSMPSCLATRIDFSSR